MLKTVVPDFPHFLFKTMVKPGTELAMGSIYPGTSNSLGAVCGICGNGETLGVKPGEFEFMEAPEWLIAIHDKL